MRSESVRVAYQDVLILERGHVCDCLRAERNSAEMLLDGKVFQTTAHGHGHGNGNGMDHFGDREMQLSCTMNLTRDVTCTLPYSSVLATLNVSLLPKVMLGTQPCRD